MLGGAGAVVSVWVAEPVEAEAMAVPKWRERVGRGLCGRERGCGGCAGSAGCSCCGEGGRGGAILDPEVERSWEVRRVCGSKRVGLMGMASKTSRDFRVKRYLGKFISGCFVRRVGDLCLDCRFPESRNAWKRNFDTPVERLLEQDLYSH